MFNSPEQPQPGEAGFDHWLATQNNAAPSHANPINFVRNGESVGPIEGSRSHVWLRSPYSKGSKRSTCRKAKNTTSSQEESRYLEYIMFNLSRNLVGRFGPNRFFNIGSLGDRALPKLENCDYLG
jgi:hypothetical protein